MVDTFEINALGVHGPPPPFFDEAGSVILISEFSVFDECIWWNTKQGTNADL
jgi:hypothetical protein